jgi:hypothetical protein
MVVTCNAPAPIPVSSSNEYYAFEILISKMASAGTGACNGCLQSAGLLLTSITLRRPGGLDDVVITAGTQQCATYRGGYTDLCPCGPWGCYDVTPARRGTWGGIKSFYR